MRATNTVATRKRRKRMLKRAEGTFGTRHTSYRVAKQTMIRSGEYAFRDRRQKKRDFRKLWITRLNAALREEGLSYSKFMGQVKKLNIQVNRKMLSELAINNPTEFKALVDKVRKAI